MHSARPSGPPGSLVQGKGPTRWRPTAQARPGLDRGLLPPACRPWGHLKAVFAGLLAHKQNSGRKK